MKRVSYKTAVNWCHNNIILCNKVPKIDEKFWEHFFEMNPEYNPEREIFQYYITDCTSLDYEFLKENFPDLVFSFSETLDTYILCVDHFGTSWSHVETDCTDVIFNNAPETDYIKKEYMK